jgi:integrase
MHGSIRKAKEGGWVADVRIGGHRRQLSAPTKKEAEARYKQEVDRLLSRGITDVEHGYTLAEARQLTIQTRWKGMPSERTAAGYAKEVVDFFGPDFELSEVRAPGVEIFRKAMAAKGNQPTTINKKVSALRAMLDQALLHGKITSKQQMPKQYKVKNTKDRVLSDKEVKGFCDFFRAIGQPEAADLLIFLLESCCRWSEAAKLKGNDVDLELRTVVFSRTKNNEPRTIPLTKQAFDALSGHMPAVPGHSVWSYSYRRYKDLFDQAKSYLGLAEDPELGIHTTRHTCATKMSTRGVDLVKIMRFGGWKTLAAVKRYLHLNTEALSACIDALES